MAVVMATDGRATNAGGFMNHRHLNCCERKIVGALLDEVGAPELLRVIGQYLANEHPSAAIGSGYRTDLNVIAGRVKEGFREAQ